MRILVYTPFFLPSLGGIETIADALSREWTTMGHNVTVVTKIPDPSNTSFPYRVIRNPSPWQLIREASQQDIFFQLNVSVKGLYPVVLCRKPWVVSHQGWVSHDRHHPTLRGRFKLALARFATNIACSTEVGKSLGLPHTVIPNPYDETVFHAQNCARRPLDLVFLGRLVSDKGASTLMEALGLLAEKGSRPSLTIIGDGPERQPLEQQIRHLGLASQVRFLGPLRGAEIATKLSQHNIIVIPSRWEEPFGVVALEGIACGCVAVGSEGGGLKEAIGPCGHTFPNGDARQLSVVLSELLSSTQQMQSCRERAAAHLDQHSRKTVAAAYLAVFAQALRGQSGHNRFPCV